MINNKIARYYIYFFTFFNFIFGLLSFLFPYDMAAFEVDFDGRFSIYETLKEDDSPGVLNFSFVHGEYSAIMRMIAVFRFALALGFASILINPRGKWSILLIALVSNLGLLIIALLESKGDGFTGSGTDMSFIFHTCTLLILMHAFKLLLDEKIVDETTEQFFRGFSKR